MDGPDTRCLVKQSWAEGLPTGDQCHICTELSPLQAFHALASLFSKSRGHACPACPGELSTCQNEAGSGRGTGSCGAYPGVAFTLSAIHTELLMNDVLRFGGPTSSGGGGVDPL